jgi:hypothetical protein
VETQDLKERNRVVGSLLALTAILYIAAVIVFIIVY